MHDRIQMPDLDLKKITINREWRWRGSAVKFTWQWMTDVSLRLMFCDISHLFDDFLVGFFYPFIVTVALFFLWIIGTKKQRFQRIPNTTYTSHFAWEQQSRVWRSRCVRSDRLAWLSFRGKNKFLSNARRLDKIRNTCTVALNVSGCKYTTVLIRAYTFGGMLRSSLFTKSKLSNILFC